MRTEILGVSFDNISMDEAVESVLTAMKSHDGITVVTPNPAMLLRCCKDPTLADAVNAADISLADGAGVLWAARFLRKKLCYRVPGADFALELLNRMNGRVFIFGGRPGVGERAAECIRALNPQITECAVCDGYTTEVNVAVSRIADFAPDFLMVCLGMPEQEMFLYNHRNELHFGVAAALGGTVDVLAGDRKRAPRFIRRLGLEWLWRAFTVPGKFLALPHIPKFMWLVFKEKKCQTAS